MSKRGRHTATKRELLAIIDGLEKRVAEQDKRIAELAKARKISFTSSKPPSRLIGKLFCCTMRPRRQIYAL